MSHRDPFYYPYYSARYAYTPSYAQVDHHIKILQNQSLRKQIQVQDQIRKQQQLRCSNRIQELENSIKMNEIRESVVRNSANTDNIIINRKSKVDEFLSKSYLDKIRELKTQRQQLLYPSSFRKGSEIEKQIQAKNIVSRYSPQAPKYHVNASLRQQRQQRQQNTENPYLSYEDQKLVQQYQNGRRAQEYQQELLEKINWSKKQGLIQNKGEVTPLRSYSYSQANAKKSTTVKKNDKPHESHLNTFKRSYIDDLRNSHQQKGPFNSQLRNRNNKKTSFINAGLALSTYQPSPLKNLNMYQKQKKLQKKNLINKSYKSEANMSKKKKSIKVINSNIKQRSNKIVANLEQTKNNALIKIQKRLYLSTIVFKDSKLRNVRHEWEHLLNTFVTEAKIRKQVKDKINNHPQVLKKHLLVTTSR